MQYLLVDDIHIAEQLKPFTLVRPIAYIRVGILTMIEKWERLLGQKPDYLLSEAHFRAKYPHINQAESLKSFIQIDSSVCPDKALIEAIQALKPGEMLGERETPLAFYVDESTIQEDGLPQPKKVIPYEGEITRISQVWDIFRQNGAQIKADFDLITAGRTSAPINDPHTIVYNPENVFLEEGVSLKACVLNAEKGVIYLGKNAQISEGSIVQGNFALGEHAVVNPGGKMRGDTTIGPYCKVGGEISNSVFFGYSNKGHDGFLGNSVVGEWCNFGADTNCSNLKNNYANIKVWSYQKNDFVDSGQQFCGVMMGDHSKAGINTMFNTGTVVGVNANIFGGDFPPKFIPSFAWGGAKTGFDTYDLPKAFEAADRMMQRRGKACDEVEQAILTQVFENRQTIS